MLLPLLLVLTACAESIISVESSIVNESILNDYEIYAYYSLPKTVLEIKIPIAINTLEEGLISKEKENARIYELIEYRYGWKPVETPKQTFSIDKKITFGAITLPDPEKRYAIAYKKAETISQTLNASFTKDGLIQSGEFAQENKAFDVAVKTMEILGPVLSAVLPLSGITNRGEKLSDPYSIDVAENPRITKQLFEADELLKVRNTWISNPLNSVNNPDMVKFYLNEIDKQLLVIKNELLGTVSKKIHYVTIHVDPPEDFEEIKLLEIDPDNGIVRTKSVESANLSDDITTEKKSKKSMTINLLARKLIEPGIIRDPETFISVSEKGNPVLNTNVFMYYNIPAKYELKLVVNDSPLKSYSGQLDKEGSDEYQIYFPQLGKVAYLPKEFKEASFTYYEDTGGLKSTKISKSADVDADRINSMYAAIDSVYKSIQEIKEENRKDQEEGDESVTEEVNEQVIRIIFQEVKPDE